ncbi:MAG TPA: glycosyltransferase, partial [bacterium]|nr:glycosyltransferase [bacterium]
NRPAVLILANFKGQKSPMDVVETARLLCEKMPEALFLWAGDGPLREQIEEKIEHYGLKQNFHLLGWHQDVASLFAASNVLFLPSLHEGLPRVVLQAMAAGRPVVATAVNGTPEAVQQGRTGFLVPPHDTSGMAQGLEKLLSQPVLARKMGKAGQKSLHGSFLIDEMLRQIEVLYAKALKAGS